MARFVKWWVEDREAFSVFLREKAGNAQPLSILLDSIQLANLHLLSFTNLKLIGLMRRRQECSFMF